VTPEAVVIGSGPNGLVAAAVLARAGWQVTVLERSDVAGGAVRSEELTIPGYVHDTYSAFYGILHCSPVFTELGLDHRVAWAHHPVPVAATIAPEQAALCHQDVERTASGLAALHPGDGDAWRRLYRWWGDVGRRLLAAMLAPIPPVGPGMRLLRTAGPMGLLGLVKDLAEPMEALARERFGSEAARVLLASGASHSDVSVDSPGSTPGALVLAMAAQDVGMPVPVGGAGRLADALVTTVEADGGSVRTGCEVRRVAVERGRAVGVETSDGEKVAAQAVLADVGPAQLVAGLVGEDQFPPAYLDGLKRFRYGTGIFKLDLALDGPVPWAAEGLAGCGVVHVMGDLDNMARAAYEARRGWLPTEPLLVVGQQSAADSSRAPAGGHTLWVETHVPPVPREGSWDDVQRQFLDRVLSRLEAHAPGLGERVVATAVRTPPALEAENPNLVGGDLAGGSNAIDQQLVFRPVPGWFRYSTPVKGLFLCSASAHPGGGVHGMVGRNCARRVVALSRRSPFWPRKVTS
jgi:phytoene dehydrogenase-like protein